MNSAIQSDIDHKFEVICLMIKTENELINQRLTWLGTFQGLLFAALAFAWDKPDAWYVVPVFCFLGTLIAVSTWIGTLRANRAIGALAHRWDEIKPKDYYLDVEGVRSGSGFFRLMPGYFIPLLFLIGWLAITVIHLFFRS